MDNSWHKFKSNDKDTYPPKQGKYIVFCVEPDRNGCKKVSQETAYYSDGGFGVSGKIVLYWKNFDYPDEFDW